ncbi:MAG: hypothetical protein J0M15_11740 [Deltaproteobacteria bacterium]|nr:hypothetical protein [Deltaproteobacteria bacterium]
MFYSIGCFFRLSFLVNFIMFFSGCSSFVKKPEVNQVKKIAILSVYANDKVVEAKGRGMVQNWDQIFKMQVAEDFLAIYKSSFKKIGWIVVEPTEVLASAEYKAMFEVKQVETSNETVNKVGNFLGDIGSKLMERSNKMNFFSPAGMYAIPFPANEKNCYGDCPPSPKKKLADLAAKLKVDGIAVIQIDFCYEGGSWTSLGGLGEAFMTAATSIKVVNKNAVTVVEMPTLQICDKSKNRAESTNSMVMNGGNLVFMTASKEKLRNMFKQATSKSAHLAMKQLGDQMK